MAIVTFVTFYDQYSPGLRIMSSCLRDVGHKCSIIYFKMAYSQEIEMPHPNPVSGEVFRDFQLREYARSDTPWTDYEVKLLLSRLEDKKSDIIGISNRSPLDKQCLPLLKEIKNKFPDTLLLAGGWGPLLSPELYLKEVDYVVFGEGEQVIVNLADAIDHQTTIDTIPNLVFFRQGNLVRNSVLKPSVSLDQFPLPDFDNPNNCLIDDNKIVEKDPALKFDPQKDTYSLLVGRGCVRSCSYCSQGQWKTLYHEYGGHHIKPQRVRSIEHILKECRLAKERGYRYISILESHLTGSCSFMLDFFKEYKKEIDLPFTAYLHPQQIVEHPEIVEAACQAGFSKGPIGVQHGSESFCREYFNRNVPNSHILYLSEMFRSRGIKIEYQFISGIPFETEETLSTSLDFVKRLSAQSDELLISRLKIFPRSPLESLVRDKKLSSQVHPNAWYFSALLYTLRPMFEDNIFINFLTFLEKLKLIVCFLPSYNFYCK